MTAFAAVAVAPTRSRLGESPLWVDGTGLYWVDIDGAALHLRAPSGEVRSVALSRTVTAIELADGPDLLAVTRSGFASLEPWTGTVHQTIRVLDDETLTLNDAAVDPRGRCWTGVATIDHSARGRLYCLDRGRVSGHLDGIAMSNGIDWSPSGELLYHVDSRAGTLTAWRYDLAQALPHSPTTLLRVPRRQGLPDGLTVDAAGDIWLAIWGAGEVWRIDPGTGNTTAVVAVPTPYVTSCAFGAAGASTLFITTAGNDQGTGGGGLLYAVDVPATAPAVRRYHGEPAGAA